MKTPWFEIAWFALPEQQKLEIGRPVRESWRALCLVVGDYCIVLWAAKNG